MIVDESEEQHHDLSDDSDYAASIQQGLGGSILMDSGEMGGFDGNADFDVVYSKENVAIHPTQLSSERITGRLRLVKQRSDVFLTWTPYKPGYDRVDSFDRHSSLGTVAKDRNLYSIKDVPLTDIHSIRRHTPPLGWQYIIIVLSSGLAYPPLYFYTGGVREFLATLKHHVIIARSADDANVFLVNNFQDPLQRSLSSLELPRALSIANGAFSQNLTNSVSSLASRRPDATGYNGSSSTSEFGGRNNHKVNDPAHDISIHVLEKFSLLTKFARETTSHIIRESQNGFNAYEKKQKRDSFQVNETASNDTPATPEETVENLGHVEPDEVNLVWGKPRQPPLGVDEWEGFLDSEGRVVDSKALRKRIFYGGVEHNLRNEIWKFLLGYYAYDSTFAEREYLASVKKSEYEIIKSQWQNISIAQARRFTKFRERRGLIEKDVVRTDRNFSYFDGDDNPHVARLHDILLTYSFYNFDLGYCQLVELLDQPLHNYLKQNDCLNYFFCFRWILIQFKREFEYEKVMHLWEVLWTHHLSEHFHLYICVAILKKHRRRIIGGQMDFDTLLKFVNELSGHINMDDVIRDAEALCLCAGENGAACIPPGTPPSMPLEEEPGDYSQPGEL